MIHNKEKIENCHRKVKELVSYLEQKYGVVYVTSGYRTKEENIKLKNSAKKSLHMEGLAVNVHIPDVHVFKIAGDVIMNILKYPIRGIGVNIFKRYIHFDFRRSDDLVTFVYGRDGYVS